MHRASFDEIENFLNTGGETRNFIREIRPVVRRKLTPELIENLAQRQQDHWKKLHTETFDAEKFEKWIERIPGCSTCRDNFRKLIESNPPRYDDWCRWTWEIHNAVNAQLGKPKLSWGVACDLWGWQT
jgi:hypothetical protein